MKAMYVVSRWGDNMPEAPVAAFGSRRKAVAYVNALATADALPDTPEKYWEETYHPLTGWFMRDDGREGYSVEEVALNPIP